MCDVSNPEDVARLAERAVQEFGRVRACACVRTALGAWLPCPAPKLLAKRCAMSWAHCLWLSMQHRAPLPHLPSTHAHVCPPAGRRVDQQRGLQRRLQAVQRGQRRPDHAGACARVCACVCHTWLPRARAHVPGALFAPIQPFQPPTRARAVHQPLKTQHAAAPRRWSTRTCWACCCAAGRRSRSSSSSRRAPATCSTWTARVRFIV